MEQGDSVLLKAHSLYEKLHAYNMICAAMKMLHINMKKMLAVFLVHCASYCLISMLQLQVCVTYWGHCPYQIQANVDKFTCTYTQAPSFSPVCVQTQPIVAVVWGECGIKGKHFLQYVSTMWHIREMHKSLFVCIRLRHKCLSLLCLVSLCFCLFVCLFIVCHRAYP